MDDRCSYHSPYLQTLIDGLEIKPAFYGNLEGCRQQGQCAGEQMFLLTQNPYPPQSAEHEFWEGGFLDSIDDLCGER